MSSFKMVPVVATEEMVAAIRDRGTQDGDCVEHTTAHMMWADAVDAAPPFVVTDELIVDAAIAICKSRGVVAGDCLGWDNALKDARAAIEAVLGGGK